MRREGEGQMTKNARKAMSAAIVLMLMLLYSCGGGNNDEKVVTILGLSISSGSNVIEAEMVKEVKPETLSVTIAIDSTLDVSNSVGTVQLTSYEISYSRNDNGVVPDAFSGALNSTIGVNSSTFPSSQTLSLEVFSIENKLFSAFAQDFRNNFRPVTINARLVIRGKSISGENVSQTMGFQIQAAVYLPIDELLPTVTSFSQNTSLLLGEDYVATWATNGRVDRGLFVSPFGGIYEMSPFNFPVGGLVINSTTVDVPEGSSLLTYPTGVLYVENPFGGATSSSTDKITITIPAEPVPEPPAPVEIVEFFPDRTNIIKGESVTLSWVTSGGVTDLGLLPDTYSGVKASFSGKNPAFDSISIAPEFSVRPILRAVRSSDQVTDSAFLSSAVTVTEISATQDPPEIVFFQAARSLVQLGRSTVLFWNLTGEYDKVELFPINNERRDVTDVNSYVTPVFISEGNHTFTLVVYGTNGDILNQSVTVNVSEIFNQPIEIQNVNQQPGTSLDNGDQASFSFTVSDPERKDSSWEVVKIAGDSASFLPRSGKIVKGLGDVSVAVNDFDDNDSGFLTFEISAYDDNSFGANPATTRAVELITFTTTGQLADTAPVITSAEFVPSGPAATPGSTGVIDFSFTDSDTLSLSWQVGIVSGDLNGVLSPRAGDTSTGSGQISVRYEDDPDTPLEPVVFLIQVTERFVDNPQSDIFLLRVDKSSATSTTDPTDPGGNPTGAPITFADDGIYANLFGGVGSGMAIPYTLYTNGSTNNPLLFRNADLSGELVGASMVVDLSHNSGDPSQLRDLTYSRDFALPLASSNNSGTMNFIGYYTTPGQDGAPSSTTIANGVGRWFFAFGVEAFRTGSGDPYNLPTVGQLKIYQITIDAADQASNTANLVKTLAISAPN